MTLSTFLAVHDPSDVADYAVDFSDLATGLASVSVSLDAAALAAGVTLGTGGLAASVAGAVATFWLSVTTPTNAAFVAGLTVTATLTAVTNDPTPRTFQRSVQILVRQSDSDLLPLSLAEAKSWLRVQTSDDDALITSLVQTTAERIKDYSWAMAGGRETVVLYFPSFAKVRLYPAPLVTVDSVAYYAVDGTLTTLDTADWRRSVAFGTEVLLPAAGTAWPATEARDDAVVVTVTAGWENRDAVPEKVRTAARIILAHLYDDRVMSAPMSMAVQELLSEWRNKLVVR